MARVKFYNESTGTWEYAEEAPAAPVQSVNGKVGTVSLNAEDVGAEKAGAVAALESKAMLKADMSTKKAQLTLEDGTVVLIDVLVASEGTVVQTYTNQMPISTDASGAVYNGTGWKGNARISGSAGTEKDATYSAAIGFVPVKPGDVVRFKITDSTAIWDTDASSTSNVIAYYNASHTWLGSLTIQPSVYGICTNADAPTGSAADGGVVSFTVPSNTNIAFVRISMVANTSNISNLIVTVNEEIS